MTIISDIQKFDLGTLIEFYEINLNPINPTAGYLRFTPQMSEYVTGVYSSVFWRGLEWTPIDAQLEGLETSTDGTLQRPKIKVSNVNSVFSAYIVSYDDLIGAEFTRYRTFAKYLDGYPAADPNAYFPPDMFRINKKVTQNPLYVEFELATRLDFENRKLPGRQIIRDYCMHIYRYYDPNTGMFDYSKATCPYTGSNCFDAETNWTTGPYDTCGKRAIDCQIRFGASAPLPHRGFFGVDRYEI